MEQRTLGRTGWRVSAIGCGTYRSFDQGGRAGQEAVNRLVRANLDAGVNLFDTAPMYGRAEATLGRALEALAGSGPRPRVATKVLQADAAGARRQIGQSLSLLGAIDLLQIHNMAGWRRVLPLLAELKAAGRIGATGITHYDPGAFAEMEAACATGQVDVIQIPYNLAERSAERRLLPLARERGLGVLVMTPIHPLFRRGAITRRLERLELAPFAPYGVRDAGGLCLKYVLERLPEGVPIPATSRTERVASNAAVAGAPGLPEALLARLERAAG